MSETRAAPPVDPVETDATETPESRLAPELPEDVVILVPVRNTVLFPGIVLPIAIGRERSIAGAQEAARSERRIGLVLQRDAEVEDPGPEDLHEVGTAANILRYVTTVDGTHHMVCQGEQRFRVLDYLPGHPFLVARVEWITSPDTVSTELEARAMYLRKRALEALELLPQSPAELTNAIQNTSSAGPLADMIASFMDLEPEDKQAVLETFDLRRRVDLVVERLNHRIEVLRLTKHIDDETKASMDKRQREYMLREQLRTIQRELGEADEAQSEIDELQEAIAKAGMPEDVEAHARKELKRFERMPEAGAEHAMLRTYLDWLTGMPWSHTDPEAIDLTAARRILDEDHYGLEKVKKRIIEFLAVRKLNPTGRSPILCFVGPPGVGKTSLGKSIARAMSLEFVRASLGGVHDEAEIRGHRRTYIGALPGNIVQAIRKAGTRNPVFMLDEVDKLGAGFHGDPSAALLEVLDPEQNATFQDNYLGVAFDLSRVLFIATANVLDQIPGPLRDRMEVIELPGYTEDEKFEIAKRYLLRRQLEATGLDSGAVELGDDALRALIRDYTREAGCRNLEREIGAVLRHAAVRIAEGETARRSIGASDLPDILGPRRFENDMAMRTAVPGVATGLAWTPAGGDILFIEATRTPGSGKLILTGQLGDVMRESAQAALSLLKARAASLEIDEALFERSDLHVHVPAGAIPKDGPSAGVAMYVALVSLLTNRNVKPDMAVTGEISLRGLVLPVGGIKEKCVAAARAGVSTVLLPARNRKDLEDIPKSAREKLEFVWLDNVGDATAVIFDRAGEAEEADGPGPPPGWDSGERAPAATPH